MRGRLFILLIGLIGVGFFTLFLFLKTSSSQASLSTEITSPLGNDFETQSGLVDDLFTQVKKEKTTDYYPPNDFFPKNLVPLFSVDLHLSADAYAVMDLDTKELLLGKNITKEKPIASLTKIMTSLIALEKEDINKEIVIPQEALQVGEASMGLSYQERYTVEQLLYGLLLVSGNDAAESLALSLGRGRNWFIKQMNQKAINLGLKDTYFFNPTGLDEVSLASSNFSTALDLLALTNYALTNPKFAEIVATKYYTIPYQAGWHKELFLENILDLNKTYPGIKGVKTGNTNLAGQTLISYAEHPSGRRLLVVLLGSQATKDEAVKIYRYFFENRLD